MSTTPPLRNRNNPHHIMTGIRIIFTTYVTRLLVHAKIRNSCMRGFYITLFLVVSQLIIVTINHRRLQPHVYVNTNIPFNSLNSTRNSTPCRSSIQKLMLPLHEQWIKKEKPVLMSVITMNNVHYILFNTNHFNSNQYSHASTAKRWMCNSNETSVIKSVCKHGHTLIVQCRNTTFMQSITFDNTTHYDLQEHIRCDKKIQANEHPIAKMANSHSQVLGACTMILDTEDPSKVLQWVEYHRLIGIDHFWIYINGKSIGRWQNNSPLSLKPYITFVPYETSRGSSGFWYQQAQQNECIYRSRSYGVSWLGLLDIDEYFHITMPSNLDTNGVGEEILPPTLLDLIETIPNNTDIGGIQFKNCFYGRRKKENKYPLLLDYTSRTICTAYGREKNMIRPLNVDYFSVHMITTGEKTVQLDPSTQGYIQHFKGADSNIYKLVNNSIFTDTSLQDMYREKLLKAIHPKKYAKL